VVQVFHFPVPEIGRTRRVMRMALAACGNGSPAAAAAVFRSRRSGRPWPWFCWLWPAGMSSQGRFLIVAYRPGWFLLHDQDVMRVLGGDHELGGLTLGVEGIGGDDAPGKVQVFQQRLEPGDLVGLAVRIRSGTCSRCPRHNVVNRFSRFG
jgi:hypothetical protein